MSAASNPRRFARWALALVAVLATGAAACIIGPKQDDPLADRVTDGGGISMDVGSVDGSTGLFDDASGSGDTAPAPSDASSADTGSADAIGDGPTCPDANPEAGDACSTGGADALTAD